MGPLIFPYLLPSTSLPWHLLADYLKFPAFLLFPLLIHHYFRPPTRFPFLSRSSSPFSTSSSLVRRWQLILGWIIISQFIPISRLPDFPSHYDAQLSISLSLSAPLSLSMPLTLSTTSPLSPVVWVFLVTLSLSFPLFSVFLYAFLFCCLTSFSFFILFSLIFGKKIPFFPLHTQQCRP